MNQPNFAIMPNWSSIEAGFLRLTRQMQLG